MRVNKKENEESLYNLGRNPYDKERKDKCGLLDYLKNNPIKHNKVFTFDVFKQGGKNFQMVYCPICDSKYIIPIVNTYSVWESPKLNTFPCDCDKTVPYKSAVRYNAQIYEDNKSNWEFYIGDESTFFASPNDKTEKYKIYLFDINNDNKFFKWILFLPEFTRSGKRLEDCEPESFDWLEGDFISSDYTIAAKGFFSFDNGFYGTRNGNKTTKFNAWLASFNCSNVEILNEDEVTFFDDVKADVYSRTKAIELAKASKTASSKKTLEEEEILEEISKYTPLNFDTRILEIPKDKFKSPLYSRYSEIGNKARYLTYCPKCEHIEILDEETKLCPKCNLEFASPIGKGGLSERTNFTYLAFTFEKLPNGSLLQRAFNVSINLKPETETIKKEIFENVRFYFEKNKAYAFQRCGGTFQKIPTANNYSIRYAHDGRFAVQSDEEIKDIVNSSIFKYSGFIDALGLSTSFPDRKICETTEFGIDCYLYSLYKYKPLEQILKCGLFHLAQQIKNGMTQTQIRNVILNTKAGDVTGALGITKPVLKIARDVNAYSDELKLINTMWQADQTLDSSTYQDIVKTLNETGGGSAINQCFTLISLKQDFNISFKEAITYMKDVWENQCIPCNEALNLWKDYLVMAKDMMYRLNNRNTKFPQSLKLEHDRAIFTNKAIVDEKTRNNFHLRAEANEQYSYHFEDLMVKIPHEPEEIISEGVELKHCVASYVKAVTDGATCIAFIRTKAEPEKSLYTAEVKNGIITEVKGFANEAPTDPVVLNFIKKWATFKGLVVAC